jgi:hypothetical protein
MAQNPALSGNLGAEAPGRDLVPITPNDAADLAVTARAVRCRPDGDAGSLRITTLTGVVRDTFIGAGETLLVAAVRVHQTGTTATDLEAYI